MTGSGALEQRVLVLAPAGRDAEVAAGILRDMGCATAVCGDLDALCDGLAAGAGAVVVTEETLATADLRRLSAWLDGQPSWSDMPFVVLTRRAGDLSRNPAALRLMGVLGNVSFLERPFHPTSFVSLVQVALRARRRQLQTREHLARQVMLTAELDHRVKNMLAVIQALVLRTRDGAGSLDEFARNLRGRIDSMTQTHGLLSESHWAGARLRDLVESEVAPYRSSDGGNVVLEGPEVVLRPRAAAALSMALHELATNAAKYGAFSSVQGRVEVVWEIAGPRGALALRWTECGGPPVRPPTRRGFGASVIERALAYEVDGSAQLEFPSEGMVCRLAIPADQLTSGDGAPKAPAPPASAAAEPAAGGRRVLVVEDSALVAMEVVEAVSRLGWRVVGPANRLREALSLAEGEALDGAVLDINLDGEFVYPVAEVLQSRGVPFVFASGYSGRSMVPQRFRAAPLVEKPFRAEGLQAALRQAFD